MAKLIKQYRHRDENSQYTNPDRMRNSAIQNKATDNTTSDSSLLTFLQSKHVSYITGGKQGN